MARGFLKSKSFTKDTLLTLATIGVVAIAATSPYFLHRLAKAYFKDKTKKIIAARSRKLRELEKRKLIAFKELGGGTVQIELTHRGKHLVRLYTLEEMRLKKPPQWDGYWRVMIYDIPSSQRIASNAFREKLRDLGLFRLQRSVWVSPYECLGEIEFLATVFEINIDHCICYFKTKEVPHEKELRKFFDL